MSASSTDFDTEAKRLETRLPGWACRFMRWVRTSSFWVRMPFAVVLVTGGIFSFLPVLGIWMIPLGLVILAQDVPFLRPPLARLIGWINSKL